MDSGVNQRLRNDIRERFDNLSLEQTITIAEYIWIGGYGNDIRSKTMCIHKKCLNLEDFPIWNYDGSSTNQATTPDSEIILVPVYFCKDPFRDNRNKDPNLLAFIVLCETFLNDGLTPAMNNFRYHTRKILSESRSDLEKPVFGWIQEYLILNFVGSQIKWPIKLELGSYPISNNDFYCGVGSTRSFGRNIAEEHFNLCLEAGLNILSMNSDKLPSKWEFQMGTNNTLESCDQLWISRYILKRLGEEHNVDLDFSSRPIQGDYDRLRCTCIFSFDSLRNHGNSKLSQMKDQLKSEEITTEYLSGLKKGNQMRLKNISSELSILNGTLNKENICDKRPPSEVDPYFITALLLDKLILQEKYKNELLRSTN